MWWNLNGEQLLGARKIFVYFGFHDHAPLRRVLGLNTQITFDILCFVEANTDTRSQWSPSFSHSGVLYTNTLSLFVEGFRNELLSGRCEYVEGLGVIAKIAQNPRKLASKQ